MLVTIEVEYSVTISLFTLILSDKIIAPCIYKLQCTIHIYVMCNQKMCVAEMKWLEIAKF